MDLDMVFNELSLQAPAPNVYIARHWMTTFIQTTIVATTLGVRRVLRFESDFFNTSLAPNYSLNVWLTDKAVNLDEQRRFRRLQTKYPVLKDFEGTEIEDQYLLSDFRYHNQPIHGLGIAYLLDALALSLPSIPEWEVNQVLLEVPEPVIVFHACRPEHVRENTPWIENRVKQGIRDGTELWQRRQEIFPHLSFCERVQEQVQNLHSGNPALHQIKKRLFEFEAYCRNWQQGNFDKNELPTKVKPESPETLKKYPQEHTFACPDGLERIFSWHVDFTPGVGRIFFFPDPAIMATKPSLENLRKERIPNNILEGLGLIENQAFTTEEEFLKVVKKQIGNEQTVRYKELILKYATRHFIIGHIGTKLPNVTKW